MTSFFILMVAVTIDGQVLEPSVRALAAYTSEDACQRAGATITSIPAVSYAGREYQLHWSCSEHKGPHGLTIVQGISQ